MPVYKRNVASLAKSGSAGLKGDVTLSEGTNITLTQTGQDIEVAAAGGAYARTATFVIAAVDSKDTTNADYICDGTADNVEINTAIAALPAMGGRVVLLEGNYNIAAALSINATSITLEGQGNSTILTLVAATNTDVVTIGATGDNSVVRNLKINGNQANQVAGGHGVNINAAADYCTVEHCWIINTAKANIYDSGATYTKLLNNRLESPRTGNGWGNIEGVGAHALIDGNICISGDYGGICVYNNSTPIGGTISNNTVITPKGPGIFVEEEGWIVIGNTILNPVTSAIVLKREGGIAQANYIEIGNNPTAVVINLNYNNTFALGNLIKVMTGNTAAVTGIGMNAGYSRAENNEVLFLTYYAHKGIVSNGQNGIKIIANRVDFGNTVTASSVGIEMSGDEMPTIINNAINMADTGIDAGGMYGWGQISNNTIFKCKQGINLNGADQTSINGNTIYINSGGTYGIKTTTKSEELQINNNLIYGAVQDAIYLVASTYCTIVGNKMIDCCLGTDNTYAGIYLSGTSRYNTIVGNVFRSSSVNNPKYGIREAAAADGANVIIGNVILSAETENISVQNVNTDVSHNITV